MDIRDVLHERGLVLLHLLVRLWQRAHLLELGLLLGQNWAELVVIRDQLALQVLLVLLGREGVLSQLCFQRFEACLLALLGLRLLLSFLTVLLLFYLLLSGFGLCNLGSYWLLLLLRLLGLLLLDLDLIV